MFHTSTTVLRAVYSEQCSEAISPYLDPMTYTLWPFLTWAALSVLLRECLRWQLKCRSLGWLDVSLWTSQLNNSQDTASCTVPTRRFPLPLPSQHCQSFLASFLEFEGAFALLRHLAAQPVTPPPPLPTAPPESDPVISGFEEDWTVGDTLELNCTSAKSFPAAQLNWSLQGRPVSDR